jgi:hypothetical protein
MPWNRWILSAIAIVAVCLSCAYLRSAENSDESKAVKEIAFGVFENGPSEAAIEREYVEHHGPSITAMSGTYMLKYQLWLPFEPPADAVKNFDAVRGRYAELWYPSMEKYLNRPNLKFAPNAQAGDQKSNAPAAPAAQAKETDASKPVGAVPWVETRAEKRVVTMVPGLPSETFLDKATDWEKATAIRWIVAMRYPDNVSAEDGEKWFLNVHAKEAIQQPGLMKFVSYRTIDQGAGQAGPVKMARWDRINEYWYENFAAWRKAVIETPPHYTAPSWGGKYPFVEVESTFIPYVHYVDFLRQKNGYVVEEK